MLVFVSTAGGVNELVQALKLALAHDQGCCVLGLYKDLNADEQARATQFNDLARFPGNKCKRLICVATSLAEASATIPGSLCN